MANEQIRLNCSYIIFTLNNKITGQPIELHEDILIEYKQAIYAIIAHNNLLNDTVSFGKDKSFSEANVLVAMKELQLQWTVTLKRGFFFAMKGRLVPSIYKVYPNLLEAVVIKLVNRPLRNALHDNCYFIVVLLEVNSKINGIFVDFEFLDLL